MTAAQTDFRLWHPAFDAYHCAFRILRILSWRNEIPVELLCVLDFYLLYPFLLHRASMPEGVRRAFREVQVERDKEQFIQIPGSTSLYRDIAVFQKTAINSLVAKKLLDREAFLVGKAKLNEKNIPAHLRSRISTINSDELQFMDFLVNKFGSIELMGARGLRALTGLVRRQ